jgi:hypothetical protein
MRRDFELLMNGIRVLRVVVARDDRDLGIHHNEIDWPVSGARAGVHGANSKLR